MVGIAIKNAIFLIYNDNFSLSSTTKFARELEITTIKILQ